MRFPLFERHPREELSGYLDNELVFPRVEAIEAHLASCPTCHAELEALRALKAQLAALPESPAPRSFALTPQMAQRPAQQPVRVRKPSRVEALSNGMRLAGAGMAVALAVVMVLNFSGSGSDSGSDNSAAAPAVLTVGSSTQSAVTFTPKAETLSSAASTSAPDDQDNTPAPPIATTADGVAGAPSAGGGVAGGPSSGGGVGAGGGGEFLPGTTTQPTDTNALEIPPVTPAAIPQTGPGEAVSSPAPAASDLEDKDGQAFGSRTDTDSADSLAVGQITQTAQPPEAAHSASTESDSGGVDILLLVAIALAAGVVLAFVGSVLIPRIARDDQ
jgi:hypothetical protein